MCHSPFASDCKTCTKDLRFLLRLYRQVNEKRDLQATLRALAQASQEPKEHSSKHGTYVLKPETGVRERYTVSQLET
jgi:hypothetical protein